MYQYHRLAVVVLSEMKGRERGLKGHGGGGVEEGVR